MSDYLGNPARYSFEEGDLVRLEGRCGKVVAAIDPGVLVQWWDDSRAWIEMSRLDNLSTGRAAMVIPAPYRAPEETDMGRTASPASPAYFEANAALSATLSHVA